MTLRLIQDLRSHSRTRAEAIAVCAGGAASSQGLNYAQLDDRVGRLAAVLTGSIRAGATVMLCYPNRVEYIAAFLGVLAADSTLFAISSDSAAPELTSAAQRSLAAAAIVSSQVAPHLQNVFGTARPLPELADGAVLLTDPVWAASHEDGPALLLQSSGTTSRPKIVRRDGPSLDAVSRAMVTACGFTADDHVLAAVPLCHSYGLEHGLLAPITAGSCVHVFEKFDLPAVLDALRYGGITLVPGVPFMFDMLCRTQSGRFPTLRRAYSAGGPLPRSTFDSFQEKFGLRIGQVYGATEIGSVTFNNPDATTFDPASVGHAMEGVSIRILDAEDPRIDEPLPAGAEGQIAIAGTSMLSGYLDSESMPLLDGYYLTGDLGLLTAEGALTLTGRLKLLVDIGGRKVNPAEVEAVLRQYPGVGACVVVAMRLSETVCRLKAIVAPSKPGTELSPRELRQFARERLSGYKVPRVFEIRDTLPTSDAGKVIRRLVES
jgi:acyl-CoA synthetase (AMP-forming)/AMP-acid ligase II